MRVIQCTYVSHSIEFSDILLEVRGGVDGSESIIIHVLQKMELDAHEEVEELQENVRVERHKQTLEHVIEQQAVHTLRAKPK